MTNLNLAVVQPPQTSAIIDSLRNQAATILASALGSQPLVNFESGGLGNFPYYYLDPATLNFNKLTYDWINTPLLGGNPPIQQSTGALFTNSFISVLSKVVYQLSRADTATLNNAYANATNQQMALLNAWKSTYGTLPTPSQGQMPIDAIMSIICTKWADPPTTVNAIQNSINLQNLLNNAPPSGQAMMPVIANYVNALGSSVTLANAQTMNNAYVNAALRALQTPSAANGGMLLNSSSTTYYPSYTFGTDLSAIINGLQSSNTVEITMDVSIASATEYSVSIRGGTSFTIPFLEFFSLGVGANASYFHDEIVKSANSVSVKMTFTGVTLVNYRPSAFNESVLQNWCFMQPILDAIKNQGQDVSGYHFSPSPGVDFSLNGQFGILQGVAISNYPSAEITVTSSNYQSIQTTFQQSVSTSISFLGIPLGGGSESTYSNSASSSSSTSTVTIKLTPPPNMVAGSNTSSVGWVLGVQTNYPAT